MGGRPCSAQACTHSVPSFSAPQPPRLPPLRTLPQIVVNVAKEYTEQLTAEKIIELLEAHKSYHGLYFYLGAHIAFSENPEVRLAAAVAAAAAAPSLPARVGTAG